MGGLNEKMGFKECGESEEALITRGNKPQRGRAPKFILLPTRSLLSEDAT